MMIRVFNMLIQNISNMGSITSATMYDDEFSKITFVLGGQEFEVMATQTKKEEKKDA